MSKFPSLKSALTKAEIDEVKKALKVRLQDLRYLSVKCFKEKSLAKVNDQIAIVMGLINDLK